MDGDDDLAERQAAWEAEHAPPLIPLTEPMPMIDLQRMQDPSGQWRWVAVKRD